MGKNRLKNILIDLHAKTGNNGASNLFALFGIRCDSNIFRKEFVSYRIIDTKLYIFVPISAGPGIIDAGKDAIDGIFTEKYMHKKKSFPVY